MKIKQRTPAREFSAGGANRVVIRHCADVELDANEQVTFVAASGSQFDVVRKSWGYYTGGSLNSRLPAGGLRAALVTNAQGKTFLLLVEQERRADFEAYLLAEGLTVTCWLDRGIPVPLA